MSFQSSFARQWRELRRLPGRIPLRVKLITALLTLVAIALAAISIAGISVLRGYLLNQADVTLRAGTTQGTVYHDVQDCLAAPFQCQPQQMAGVAVDWVPPSGKLRQVVVPADMLGGLPGEQRIVPGPAVTTKLSWLMAHPGQPVTVPAESGGTRWRVLAFHASYLTLNGAVSGTVIVGLDVSSAYRTLGTLASIDLVVSGIVVAALAIVGVAIVRTSLRPLADIEHTAQAIAAGDLSRRVPDRDPRTEVGRLGRALNMMLSQIEAAFHARAQSEAAARRSEKRMRQFVADASHELRTPLTAIRGYAEYYRQRGGVSHWASQPHTEAPARPGGPAGNGVPTSRSPAVAPVAAGDDRLSEADMDRIMQRVEQESARMGVLVEDMLLLARLDQQRPIERRPVDLLTLAADTVQDARMIAPSRSIELSVGSGAAFLVLGDEVRLRQVIGNLMSNALTHTPEGTPIEVRLRSETLGTGGDQIPGVVLAVSDTGPGLTAEQAEHVFERFYRADQARNRKRGGAGLGLAIVSALVAAHGGTVAVETEPGQGATFTITLPLAPDATTS